MITPIMLHYFSACFALAIACIGAGLGQGFAGMSVLDSMNRQPLGNNNNFNAMIIGLALIESGIIIALVITLITLFGTYETITWGIALSEMGIGLMIGVAAASTSIASGFVVKASSEAIARQPFFYQKILTVMLLSQSIIEAPIVFAFIVSLLIRLNMSQTMDVFTGIKHLSAGIVLMFGCIGPSIGQAIFAHAACKAIGRNKKAYNKIFTFSLFSQAFIETPIIFCLVFSLIIIFSVQATDFNFIEQSFKTIISAFTLGFGSIGTAIGIGYASSKSCTQIARDPENYGVILRTTLLVEAFIESSVIYAMIIAMLLLVST